jgi:cation:H+ antiporter
MWYPVGLFVSGAAVVLLLGSRFSRVAEELADAMGIGQTIGGMILLGASTSLPGVIISFDTALGGQATLSVSNAVGGIAAQTAFIAIADAAMRRGPLSEEVTMAASLMQLAVLLFLLTLALLAMLAPNAFVLFDVHLASLALVVAVILGFRMVQTSEVEPKWYSRRLRGQKGKTTAGEAGVAVSGGSGEPTTGEIEVTASGETEEATTGESEEASTGSTRTPALVGEYLLIAAAVGGAGWLISYGGQQVMAETELSPMLVGMTGMAIASSLPELVTSVAAAKRGAVALAIGDIIGGNVFDTLMLALADFAYSVDSIYAHVTLEVLFLVGMTTLMSSVLLIMLVRRETEDLGTSIGTESYLILVIYVVGSAYILL